MKQGNSQEIKTLGINHIKSMLNIYFSQHNQLFLEKNISVLVLQKNKLKNLLLVWAVMHPMVQRVRSESIF